MTFVDPTMHNALEIWGETVTVNRDPQVALTAVYSAPDSLRNYGGITVDTIDAALHVRTADVAALSLQPGDRITVRGQLHHVVANPMEDDGAGATVLLRRLVA
jgi:hypothetical protein